MVTVDERIQSPLMMSEPQWTPDSSVSFVGLCTVTLVVKVVVFDEIRHYMCFFERRCHSGEGWSKHFQTKYHYQSRKLTAVRF